MGVILTVDDASNLENILAGLRQFFEVRCEPNRAVVCIVGENLKSTHAASLDGFLPR